ncbi:replicative DNA helicase [Streptomyces sp. NBC_00160]|uniref:DnaB-like helicase N-terminal domain-containing protein n=1 Tax=Streptomyces sp. NBC_00160 TaxID=2903628 RepID=UPI002252D26D|nr:DnaB-like helicase N-terminal domain-containing protein [Streptomyces sp. NBC_00160]MCX5309016.1 replicative DNA helicase [Streptomyces sp. NBC_00160]
MPKLPVGEADFDLDSIPPDPPVHYAEQALLGALLLEPHRLKTIGPLSPEHFSRALHAAVFAAICALTPPAPAIHAKEPVWLASILSHASPTTPALTPAYLHTLIACTGMPEHAAEYARMIRADHARRAIRVHAELLVQAACDPTPPEPATVALARADALAALLDDLGSRFSPHPGSLPRTPPSPALSRDTDEDTASEEQLLLSTATAHPDSLPTMPWLQADDFAVPVHGQLFRCLTSLAYRGAPVDKVTVLWEAQHQGILTEALTARDVLELLATPAGSAQHWGEQVLRRALLHGAHTAGLRIQAYAEDRTNTPHQLITGSRRALAELTAVRIRWQRATSTTPATPPRSHAPATARAGSRALGIAPSTARVTR